MQIEEVNITSAHAEIFRIEDPLSYEAAFSLALPGRWSTAKCELKAGPVGETNCPNLHRRKSRLGLDDGEREIRLGVESR